MSHLEYARRLCQFDHIKADDLVQDARIAAWAHGGIDNPERWMVAHIRRGHLEMRKRARREERELALWSAVLAPSRGWKKAKAGEHDDYTSGGSTLMDPAYESDADVCLIPHDGGVPSTTGRRILYGQAYVDAERAKARERRAQQRNAA